MHTVFDAIRSGGIKPVILDTDTYNEIDDQFALAYAILANDRIRLLSVNAAPFLNDRSQSPEDGMEKSYQEIGRILRILHRDDIPFFRGSTAFMKNSHTPQPSEAAQNIIDTVRASQERVYIVAIGAITNVASACLMAPDILERIAIIWLGGHAHHYPHTREFNLWQDIAAARVFFDGSMPLIQVPCMGMCSELATTLPELTHYLQGKNALCDYLLDIFREYAPPGAMCWSKVIWDIAAVACLALPGSMDMVEVARPIVTSDGVYAFDNARPAMGYIRRLERDRIFADVFTLLAGQQV
nr:nucleoside hydrolase [bacterium]